MTQIKLAAEKLDMAEADVIREATKIGLEKFKRINWNIAGAIIDASEQTPSLRVAEDGPKYGNGPGEKK